MKKEMIDTIVNLLSDLPDNKATSVMEYVRSLNYEKSAKGRDGVYEALDLFTKEDGYQAGP